MTQVVQVQARPDEEANKIEVRVMVVDEDGIITDLSFFAHDLPVFVTSWADAGLKAKGEWYTLTFAFEVLE